VDWGVWDGVRFSNYLPKIEGSIVGVDVMFGVGIGVSVLVGIFDLFWVVDVVGSSRIFVCVSVLRGKVDKTNLGNVSLPLFKNPLLLLRLLCTDEQNCQRPSRLRWIVYVLLCMICCKFLEGTISCKLFFHLLFLGISSD
jgi:hypothetical protein